MNKNLLNAIPFAKAGWKLFPSRWSNEKHYPCIEWSTKSSSEIPALEKWVEQWPNCYFCVNLKASGLTVVDVDNKKGKKGGINLVNLENQYGNLPETMEAKTPNAGVHYVFKGYCARGVDKLAKGIDIPVMIPLPGQHVKGKGEYVLCKKGIPAPLPEWIINFVGIPTERREDYDIPISEPDKNSNVERAILWLKSYAPEAIQGNGGDAVTFQIACKLRDFNVSEATALELLSEHWNETKAFPPWDQTELEKKIANAFKYAKDRPGNATPEAMFSSGISSTAMVKCAAETKIEQLQPRQWLLGHRYLLGFTTLTIAPGGAGKSLLTILEAISVASGKRLTHDEVKLPGAVWLFNTEDPFDELSLRIMAAAKQYNLTKEDLENFYYSSAYDNPLTLVSYDDRNRPVINEPLLGAIVNQIRQRRIKLFILDPFVECHQVNENDNGAINMVMRSFRKIAKETGCAISIVHHTSKGAKDTHGNMDKARGASALASAARIAHTFYTMSEKEALQYGITPARASWYTRLDSAKANLAPPSESFEWFEKKSVKLFYDNDETTGVLEAVQLDQVIGSGSNESLASAAMSIVDRQGPTTLKKIAEEIKAAGVSSKAVNTITDNLEEIFSMIHEHGKKEYRLDPLSGNRRVLTCWER